MKRQHKSLVWMAITIIVYVFVAYKICENEVLWVSLLSMICVKYGESLGKM